MSYFDLEIARPREIFPGVHIRVAWGQSIMLSLITFQAGSSVPRHSHPHEQAGIVLEGEFDLVIGGERRRLFPGDTYLVPGGIPHAVENVTAPAKGLDIFSPPREDYMG